MKKIIVIVLCFLMFVIGLTFDIDYREPYYEARGAFVVEQELLGVYFIYTWNVGGFGEKYPAEWDIGRIKNNWPKASIP